MEELSLLEKFSVLFDNGTLTLNDMLKSDAELANFVEKAGVASSGASRTEVEEGFEKIKE